MILDTGLWELQERAGLIIRPGLIIMARTDRIMARTTDRIMASITHQFYPTRKEGRSLILQKPAQGHENYQHSWSSRRLSEMKTFKHESHVDLTC